MKTFWYKSFKVTWSAILRYFNQWIEKLDKIPNWLTQGRTLLLLKTEGFCSERNFFYSYLLQDTYGHDW